MGTTRRDAGSAEKFRKVDLDYVVNSSRLMKESGVHHLLLLSSIGAKANSWFLYPQACTISPSPSPSPSPFATIVTITITIYIAQTKGESEAAVSNLGFDKVSIFRPGFLQRGEDARWVEKIATTVLPGMTHTHTVGIG